VERWPPERSQKFQVARVLTADPAWIGADLYRRGELSIRLQADAQNLSNTLEVIDFGGRFSGNAVGPPRQFTLRLLTTL
jgi:hypothetical protein